MITRMVMVMLKMIAIVIVIVIVRFFVWRATLFVLCMI